MHLDGPVPPEQLVVEVDGHLGHQVVPCRLVPEGAHANTKYAKNRIRQKAIFLCSVFWDHPPARMSAPIILSRPSFLVSKHGIWKDVEEVVEVVEKVGEEEKDEEEEEVGDLGAGDDDGLAEVL